MTCKLCGHRIDEHSSEPGVGCLASPYIDPCEACPCTEPGTSGADQ